MKTGDFPIPFTFLQPYVIAEIGVNHGGSMEKAKEMIEQVSRTGAQAAKFQTYKAENLAARHSPAYWDRTKEPTASQYELFKKYDTFEPDDYRELAKTCGDYGIDFLSTPFDLESVELLDSLMPFFKIASADITNVPLLRRIASKHKPVVLSTGASTLAEVQSALDVLRAAGARHIALLHCVLNYPTQADAAQLAQIGILKRCFPECPVGYSDHVVPQMGTEALELAASLGAVILEKHFTYDKSLPGNDHYHAADEGDLTRFMSRLRVLRRLHGSTARNIMGQTLAKQHARRGIYAAADLSEGHRITENDIVAKRPVAGIGVEHWDLLIGEKLRGPVSRDCPIEWKKIE